MSIGLAPRTLKSQYSRVRPVIDPELNRHWNQKLKGKHALAPADWLNPRQYLVTNKIYNHQNDHWSTVIAEYMLEELQDMWHDLGPKELHRSCFTVNGPGLFRDGLWVPTANSLGLSGIFCEAATLPYNLAKRRLRLLNISKMNFVRLVEIKGEQGEIHEDSVLIFDSGFKGILPRKVMEAQGRAEGRQLRRSGLRIRIVIAHAEEDDNKKDVLWGDRIEDELKQLLPEDFPYHNVGVLWGDHSPYPFGEVLVPISEGLGRAVQVKRSKQFMYYHQRWKIATVVSS